MNNFIKIYFWQFLSVVFNLGSLFIVTPSLAAHPSVFGIYSLCLTSLLFFSYADFGFISATYKYACEFYIKGDKENEQRVTGFALFIFFVFALIYSVFIFLFAYDPQIIIKNKLGVEELKISRSLFLILAISSPILVLQRFLQLIFGIRLKDYFYYRINLFFNILKIVSVFYFFRVNHYDIVGYFAFIQCMNFGNVLFGILLADKKLEYKFTTLFRYTRFSSKFYNLTKKLAYSTFFLTLSWIIYYELNTFAIGKLLSTVEVGIYAIGLTILSLFRNFFGVIYNPFSAKFNHLIGLGRKDDLRNLIKDLIKMFMPVFLFSIIILCILMKPFIISWVGIGYNRAIFIAQLLIACNLMGFISYPGGILMMALEETKKINLLAIVTPLIYWTGVFLTLNRFGILSFALFSLVVFFATGLFYLSYLKKFLAISWRDFFFSYLKNACLPLAFLFLVANAAVDYLPLAKSHYNLFLTIITGGVIFAVAFTMYIFLTKDLRIKLTLGFKNFKKLI